MPWKKIYDINQCQQPVNSLFLWPKLCKAIFLTVPKEPKINTASHALLFWLK